MYYKELVELLHEVCFSEATISSRRQPGNYFPGAQFAPPLR